MALGAPRTPRVLRTRAELREALAAAPRPLGLVPTMGALHAGHASLIVRAREASATVLVSIFVNPRQFNDTADFEKYPKDEGADLRLAGGAGAAWLIRQGRWGRAVTAALGLWMLSTSAAIYPDHLSYFNEFACVAEPGQIGLDGGSRCGTLWLDDSNVDWGQGLKQLKTWLDVHAPGRLSQDGRGDRDEPAHCARRGFPFARPRRC